MKVKYFSQTLLLWNVAQRTRTMRQHGAALATSPSHLERVTVHYCDLLLNFPTLR